MICGFPDTPPPQRGGPLTDIDPAFRDVLSSGSGGGGGG